MSISSRIFILATAVSLIAGSASNPAAAQDTGFYLKVGSATLMPSEAALVSAGGTPVPGGSIAIENHTTVGVEIGYSFTPNWSVALSGGVPPTIDFYGAGSLGGTGKLGSVTYGPMAVTLQYAFTDLGPIKPYIGGGPLYMFVFDNEDGVVSDLNLAPALGVVIQAGVDIDIAENVGIYFDVKKALLSTTATGNLGTVPISAEVTLDPLVIGAGLKFRF